jgi:hypothetical protein
MNCVACTVRRPRLQTRKDQTQSRAKVEVLPSPLLGTILRDDPYPRLYQKILEESRRPHGEGIVLEDDATCQSCGSNSAYWRMHNASDQQGYTSHYCDHCDGWFCFECSYSDPSESHSKLQVHELQCSAKGQKKAKKHS